MTVLSDQTIIDNIESLFGYRQPLPTNIQPCSVDLRLDKTLKTLNGDVISIRKQGYSLKPGEFILGSTFEEITLPNHILARVEGRSSTGRLGILCHITAGFIDPGFHGNITLELYNCSSEPFLLEYGDALCQIVFQTINQPVQKPYDGKYQGDHGVQCSRWKQ